MDGTPPRKIPRTNFGPYLEMKSRKSLCVIKSVCMWVRERDKVWIFVSFSVLESVCVGEWERKSESVRWNGCFLQYSNVTSFFRLHFKFSLSFSFQRRSENILFPFINFVDWNFFSLSSLSLFLFHPPSLFISLCLSLPLSSSLSLSSSLLLNWLKNWLARFYSEIFSSLFPLLFSV